MELYDIEKKVSWNGDEFIDEILVDFSNEGEEEELGLGCGGDDVEDGNISADTSTVSTAVDSCNSSFSGEEAVRGFTGAGLSGDLCEPQLDELAELEWLSNFAEESFSSEDLQKLQIISPSGLKSNTLSTNPVIKTETISTSIKTEPTFTTTTIPSPSSSFTNRHSAAAASHPGLLIHLPCKARSKRSRSSGPSSWSSAHILGLGPAPAEPSDSNNSTNPILVKKLVNKQPKKREMPMFALAPLSAGRRCLHCETDKTPQWRTGPMGPKTLCNACGVRYKSGRLVPEYRPAASPTFVVSRHSNSHRKVIELRRQKEMHLQHLQQHQLLLHHGASPAHERNGDDFLIHHQIGPNFWQLI